MERKQARMKDQSSAMENLPSPILVEIISRLPIKTVMAIRCVSTSLLNIVSDPHFQILHSTRAPTELLLRDPYQENVSACTTLYFAEPLFRDDSLTAVDMKLSAVFGLPRFSVRSENECNFGATKTRLTLVNSCCGLLCFYGPYGNRFVVICNPITREYVMFPCPVRKDKTIEKRGICYGLGFSPKDHKFKLLRLIYRKHADTDSGEEKSIIVGELYTFGERGSWKRVANCPDVPYLPIPGLGDAQFHEGALHWYCSSDDVIVTFDFDTEQFGKLATPPRMCDMHSYKTGSSACMGVFESCLYTTACAGDCVDIWVLKDYGRGSWIKAFSIQKDANRLTESNEPIKYLQNGEILMFKNFGCIVCYNPCTGSVTPVGGSFSRDEAVSIKPSLVSLKVLLGDNVKVHSVKSWDRIKAATVPRMWYNSVVVKNVVKADKESQGISAPGSSSEALASTSYPTEVKEDECGSRGKSGSICTTSSSAYIERLTQEAQYLREQLAAAHRRKEELDEAERTFREMILRPQDAQRDLEIQQLMARLLGGQSILPPAPTAAPHSDDDQ